MTWTSRPRLIGGTLIPQGLSIEMLLTINLVFVVIRFAVVKQKPTCLALVGMGIVFFLDQFIVSTSISQLCWDIWGQADVDTGAYYTGGSANPARCFSANVINRNFSGYQMGSAQALMVMWTIPSMGMSRNEKDTRMGYIYNTKTRLDY